MTSEKHFINSIYYLKDQLFIKTFQKFLFYAFNAIIKLFSAIVYIRIITVTLIFDDHPLVEYPLKTKFSACMYVTVYCTMYVYIIY